jgi:hypothetical protein
MAGQVRGMTLMHCPLCMALAVLATIRAASHLSLAWLRIVTVKGEAPVFMGSTMALMDAESPG